MAPNINNTPHPNLYFSTEQVLRSRMSARNKLIYNYPELGNKRYIGSTKAPISRHGLFLHTITHKAYYSNIRLRPFGLRPFLRFLRSLS